ncbi:MAG: EpsI family protein [Acidobacteria bacterium]|nr:EpsI family protein [Acidobacteriota bacterium]
MNTRIWTRTAVASVVLLATATLLGMRSTRETIPPSAPLSAFPAEVGTWTSQDLTIEPEVKKILGDGDFISRLYSDGQQAPVQMFIAYYKSQRAGDAIHSPRNCLPGSGWDPVDFQTITIPVKSGAPIVANRVVVANGSRKQLVLYWYQSHGRSVASEYLARYYMVADSIRLHRTDGSMIRLVSPVVIETEERAQQRLEKFAEQIAGDLPRFIPN